MAGWSHWIVDTRTGVKQLQVFPSAGSWSRKLNGSGAGSHTFQLGGPTVLGRAALQSFFTTMNRTLVVSRISAFGIEVARYAGVIDDLLYDCDARQLTISTIDVRDIFLHRFPFGSGSYATGSFVCTNLSYRAIAATAVARGLIGPRSNYSLPIGLPDGAEAGTHSKTYYSYNFTNVYDLLNEVQKLGPDIDFEPSWSSGGALQWTMRVGSEAAPALTGGTFEWSLSSPQPGLIGVSRTKNASKQANGVFAIGSGSGFDMAVGGLGIPNSSIASDVTISHKDEDSEPRLSEYAYAALLTFQSPTLQWTAGLLASDPMMPIESAQLGSTLRFHLRDDPYLDDGVTVVRLIGYSGDLSETIKLDIQ